MVAESEAPTFVAECGSEGMEEGGEKLSAVGGGEWGETWHIRRIRELIQCVDSLLDRISPAMPGRPPPSQPPPPTSPLLKHTGKSGQGEGGEAGGGEAKRMRRRGEDQTTLSLA